MGAFIGDSIGSYVEFQEGQPEKVLNKAMTMPGGGPFNLARGQITDDSEHALCLGHGLVRSKRALGQYDFSTVSRYYKFWVNTRPFDIGNNTRSAFGPYYDKTLSMNSGLNLKEV